MMGRLLILLSVIFLSSCSPKTFPLEFDPGGGIEERVHYIRQLRRSGEPIRAPRTCLSACTMYMSLPNACFQRGGILGFHSASYNGRRHPPFIIDYYNQLLADHYTPNIARWFLSGPAKSLEMVYIPAAELIDSGELKECIDE